MAERRREGESSAPRGTAATLAAAGVATAEAGLRMDARARVGNRLRAGARVGEVARGGVSKGEADSLRRYTTEAFTQVNKMLRTGEVREIKGSKLVAAAPEKAGALGQKLGRIASDVNAVLGRSTLPEGARLFRGMGTQGLGPIAPGAILSDPAIQSATTRMGKADQFYQHAAKKGRDAAMMVIDAGGARGAGISGFSKYAHEAEVAMQSGTKLAVQSVAPNVRRGVFDTARNYVFAKAIPAGADAAGAVAKVAGKGAQAMTLAGRVGSLALKATPVLSAAAVAGTALYEGMKDDSFLRGAARGALTALDPTGLAEKAFNRSFGDRKGNKGDDAPRAGLAGGLAAAKSSGAPLGPPPADPEAMPKGGEAKGPDYKDTWQVHRGNTTYEAHRKTTDVRTRD